MDIKKELEDAIRYSQHQTVREMLKVHPELINVPISEYDDTPLTKAVSFSDYEMIRLLLEEFHADPNIGDDERTTALWSLSMDSRENLSTEEILNAIDLLIAHGANPNLGTYMGMTPLMLAARNVNLPVAQKLLAHGADAKQKDIDGSTPLHWLPLYSGDDKVGVEQMIQLLISHGADIHDKDDQGETPLDTALVYKNPVVIEAMRAYS